MRTQKGSGRWDVFCVMAAILLGVCALDARGEDTIKGHGADPSKKSVVVAVEFNSHAACAHVARSKGWYKEAGISIQAFDSYMTGMSLASALTRGDVDAAYICLIPAICAYANARVPLQVVSGTHHYGYAVVADPARVSDPGDLEKPGIRIGCTREGSPTDVLLQKMIRVYGLDAQKVVGNLRRMNPPKQLMALGMGHLDAAVMPEQYPSMARENGFSILVRARALWPEMQGSVLIVTDQLLQEYPEIVNRLVQVTRKATGWINAHPEAAAHIVAGALGVTSDRIFPTNAVLPHGKFQVSPQTILASLTRELVCTTRVDPFQVQQTIHYLVELGYIPHGFDAGRMLSLEP